jgi:hypothetical protein
MSIVHARVAFALISWARSVTTVTVRTDVVSFSLLQQKDDPRDGLAVLCADLPGKSGRP